MTCHICGHKGRFHGAHILGWVIEGIAILLFPSTAVLSVWDGVRNGFGFLKFFARFLIVLYIKVFQKRKKTIRSARDLLLPGSNRGPAERKGVIKMGDQRKYIAMIVLQSILYGAMDVISKLVYPSIRPMAQRCRSQTDRPSAF